MESQALRLYGGANAPSSREARRIELDGDPCLEKGNFRRLNRLARGLARGPTLPRFPGSDLGSRNSAGGISAVGIFPGCQMTAAWISSL
jgi:hypothetical protein